MVRAAGGLNVGRVDEDSLREANARAPHIPHLWRRVAGLFGPFRTRIVLTVVLVIAASGAAVVPPLLIQRVFDQALFPPEGSPNLRLLTVLVSVMIAIFVASAALGVMQTYLTSQVGNEVAGRLRIALFDKLQSMEMGFFTRTKTGVIQSRLHNDVGGVAGVLTTTVTSIVGNAVTVAASLVAMIILDWRLTVIAVILMPALVAVQRRVGQVRAKIAARTQESLSEMTAITQEALSVSGIVLSKTFHRQDFEMTRYRDENRRQVRLQVRQALSGQGFFALVTVVMSSVPAVIYLAAGWLLAQPGEGIFSSAMTAGTIVAFTAIQGRLLFPLMALMRVALEVQTSRALFARIFEYLDLRPAIADPENAIDMDDAPGPVGQIEFRSVSFAYEAPFAGQRARAGDGELDDAVLDDAVLDDAVLDDAVLDDAALDDAALGDAALDDAGSDAASQDARSRDSDVRAPRDATPHAVQDVSLIVRPGEHHALVGPSGAGKTSLLYLVARLHDVSSGEVLVSGVNVRDVTRTSLMDSVGMVTQETYLFHASIADNVRYAKPGATDAEIREACRGADIDRVIQNFPEGYQTIVGERGYRLSGGERQRIAIARVLLKDPPILLLDEATSALDTVSEATVRAALARAAQGRTTLTVAHRLSTVEDADCIHVIDGGRVVESGTHEELVALGGLYAQLAHQQRS